MIRLNNEKIKNKNYNIVSLGYNCFPRSILTRFGLKPRKADGELSLPFDIAAFSTKEITHLLQNDFEDFFDDWEYIKPKQLFCSGYWTKKNDKISFLHETKYKQNEFETLKKVYQRRIENFRKIVGDPTPILFVQLLGDDEDVENLYFILKTLRCDKPFRFFVIDPFHLTRDLEYKLRDDRLNIFKPLIPKEYFNNWWKKSSYKSRAGKSTETEIVDCCLDELSKLVNTFH